MNVAILTDGISPFVLGGMQRHSHYLCAFLVRNGVRVHLVHCTTGNGDIPSESEVRQALGIGDTANFSCTGLRFPRPGAMPGHYIKESYQYSVQVYKALDGKWGEFDLIYAKGFSAWHLINLKKKGIELPPVALKFHGYEMFQPAPDFKSRLQYYLLRGPVRFCNIHADRVFSYGGKISAIIRSLGVNPERIIEIPTGIASSWLRNPAELTAETGELNFVFTGRYERRKGIEELNTVLKELIPERKFRFHFIGPVPPSRKIKSEHILYHGRIDDPVKMRTILDECHVLVTPSHSEGMPNVIMEGMARGLAVIATDVGAVAAQVDSENGFLLPPSSTSALKQAMERCMELDGPEILALREASIRKIRDTFTWEQVISQTITAFRSITAKG